MTPLPAPAPLPPALPVPNGNEPPDLFELLTASVNGGKTPDPSVDYHQLVQEAADAVHEGTRIKEAIRACAYDLLFADVEFDMRVFEHRQMRMAFNCWSAGGNVDWNAVMPAVLQSCADKILRDDVETLESEL